jgi:hypothetical protein
MMLPFDRILSVAAAVLLGTTCLAQESRVWTSSKNGRQFEGTLVKVDEESIAIRRASDNALFRVQKTDLIQEDLDWIAGNPLKGASADPVDDLSSLVSTVPASTGTPAIGVLLVMDGETRGIGVSGMRKSGSTRKAASVMRI